MPISQPATSPKMRMKHSKFLILASLIPGLLAIHFILVPLIQMEQDSFLSVMSRSSIHREQTPDGNAQMRCSVMTDVLQTPPPHMEQPELITFNSRSYCKVENSLLCVSENVITGFPQPSSTLCSMTSASVKNVLERPFNCSELHERVLCTHGYFPHPRSPLCPMQPDRPPFGEIVHLNSTSIIVPAYPHLGNIFHFSFVVMNSALLAVTHVHAREGERQHMALIFRGKYPWQLGMWQKWTMQVVKKRLSLIGIDADIYALGQSDMEGRTPEPHQTVGTSYCSTRSIIMGPRQGVNLWPFPTGKKIAYTEISNKTLSLNDGSTSTQQSISHFPIQSLSNQPNIPVEALAWRVSSYIHANLSTKISHSVLHGNRFAPAELWVDLPPLVVGYARRNTKPDPPPGQPMRGGPIRRLSDADEEWLMSMMRNESVKEGFEFRMIQTTVAMPIVQQVSIFHGTGVVVGLHGANLVNSIFMPPFSSLVEISPINLPCYNGGMNSGLLAWRVITNRPATPEESSCPPNHQRCKNSILERRVLLDEETVRARVNYAVRQAIENIKFIRRRFRKLGAVPVLLDEEGSTYFINWKKLGAD